MRLETPAYGLMSGAGTALGLTPHIVVLSILVVAGIPIKSLTPLIVFTILAKLLGEVIFWDLFKTRMDSIVRFKNWRKARDQSLLSHPNVISALTFMILDAFVDGILVYAALKTSLPPIWIILSLFGCQALSSPIQGVLSDYFSQKKSILFAAVIGILALFFAIELPLEGKNQEGLFLSLLYMTGISTFPIALQMVLILCGKGLLGNLTVISRAAIAQVIKMETIEKYSKI
jgi:hypothetical protein